MKLKLFGDRLLSPDAPNAEHFTLWEVKPTLPLGDPHNVDALRSLIHPENRPTSDLALVAFQPGSAAATSSSTFALSHLVRDVADRSVRLLDPALSPLDLNLADGACVFVTSHPPPALLLARKAQQPNGPSWFAPPIESSTMRFGAWGDCLSSANGVAFRTVVKAANAQPTWEGSAARGSAVLEPPAGGSGDENGGGATDSSSCACLSFSIRSIAVQQQPPGSVVEVPPKVSSCSNGVLPRVCIGVADGNVPIDGSTQRIAGVYARSWRLDVLTGAVYSGGDPRPISFLDAYHYRPTAVSATEVEIQLTIVLDIAKGQLFFLHRGHRVGGVSVTKYLADSLYPVCEICTPGTCVSIA
jgi:hypothetical protein